MAEASTSSGSSSNLYKLSRELVGHEDEILALAVFKNGNIVSASKDKTSRLWRNENDNYTECIVMKGHSSEVSAVCVIEPTEKNPTGFIITGGYDNKVCIFYPGGEKPIETLEAHKNIVNQLKASNFESESFFSCSSDNTGKLWDLYDLKVPASIFIGHATNSAVGCIADLDNGLVITGGSDKTVIVYERNGPVLHKILGHTDDIKDIALVNNTDFLTCSKDSEIRLWHSLNGVCLKVFSEHTNCVNCITTNLKSNLAVSCGDDQTIRIWHEGEVKQIMLIPTKTVWNVKFLSNEDIVCGSSDKDIRIFTINPARFIDKETMHKYELKVLESIKNSHFIKSSINKLRKEILDTKELNQPGEKDGDTVIVKKNGRVKVHRWCEKTYQWNLVGDVLENKNESTGKPTYNGIEYDYVFSVDVKKGAPLLKLPYNKGQNPYEAAQQFLEDNDLDPEYLNEVANFIVTNLQINPILNAEAQYQNPFAGGSRYVSNAWPEISSQINKSQACDIKYIPQKTYLKHEQGNISAIQDKLMEFYTQNQDILQNVTPENLKSLIDLISSENSVSVDEKINYLISFLNWPDNIVFPVLDIARLAVLQKNLNEKFCENGIFNVLKRNIQETAAIPNQMLTFRLLANLFCHDAGEKFCLHCKDEVLDALTRFSTFENKNNQIAASTYVLNLVIALNKTYDIAGKEQILKVISRLVEILKEPEALFRILIGLGTLIIDTANVDNRKKFIQHVKMSRPIISVLKGIITEEKPAEKQSKLYEVSKQIIKLIR